MGNGRKTKAPCGHWGEVIIGTYVACKKCDGQAAPKHIEPEKTKPLRGVVDPGKCPRCGSQSTEFFHGNLDALKWYVQQPSHVVGFAPEAGDCGCWACAYSWTP